MAGRQEWGCECGHQSACFRQESRVAKVRRRVGPCGPGRERSRPMGGPRCLMSGWGMCRGGVGDSMALFWTHGDICWTSR